MQQLNAGLHFALKAQLPKLNQSEHNPDNNGECLDSLEREIRVHREAPPLMRYLGIRPAELCNGRRKQTLKLRRLGLGIRLRIEAVVRCVDVVDMLERP